MVDVPGITSHEHTLPDPAELTPNTTFYWRVRSFNTLGHYSTWSLVRTLRTAIAPPALVSPIDTEITTDRTPTFDWGDMAGATGYTIQISKNITFTLLVGTYTVTPSTFTPSVNLPVGTLYWRVRANGSNGPSLWSETRTLIVQ